jgi:hypothetical protein
LILGHFHVKGFVFEGQILYCRSGQTRYEFNITIDDADEMGLAPGATLPNELSRSKQNWPGMQLLHYWPPMFWRVLS